MFTTKYIIFLQIPNQTLDINFNYIYIQIPVFTFFVLSGLKVLLKHNTTFSFHIPQTIVC